MNEITFGAKSLTAISMAAACIATASAQSYHPSTDYGANDLRAGASIVIPFGGDKKKTNTKPRVEFSFQQSTVQQDKIKLDFNRYSLQAAPITNPNSIGGRIGFTLDQNPKMLVNGKSYRIDDDQNNISTLGKVGIGVAAAAVTYAIVIAVVFAANVGDGDD